MVSGWAEESASAARQNKGSIFGAGPVATRALCLVETAWGPVCGTLFDEFRWWAYETRDEKDELLARSRSGRVANPLEPLHSRRGEHYAQVLKFFDTAIEAIQGSASSSTPIQDEATPISNPDSSTSATPCATPSILTPPTAPAECRRSARIRDLRVANGEPSPAPTRPSKAPIHLEPEQPNTQIRRSARLQKRRLEEDDQIEAPPPKAKRIKKNVRVAARVR